MIKNTIFIIPSVIYFKDKPLSYSKIRSKINFKAREKQTLNTVISIRKFYPEAKIILVELGFKKELSKILQNSLNEYLYLGDKKIIRLMCDSPYKGLGEAIGLIYVAYHLKKTKNIEYIFKISGRYFLNNNFNKNSWKYSDNITAKIHGNTISTRLYGFPFAFLNRWKNILLKSLPLLLRGKSIEYTMKKFLGRDITEINTLGVSGIIGPSRETINE